MALVKVVHEPGNHEHLLNYVGLTSTWSYDAYPLD